MLSTLNKTRILFKKNQVSSKRYAGTLLTGPESELYNLLMSVPSLTAMSVGAITVCLFCRYKVAGANQYLVRTGFGIRDIKISKQGFQLPFQTYKYINMNPKNYTFDIHGMSSEKIEFLVPGVFTIGPKNNIESLARYVRILSGNNFDTRTFDDIILGILEGEVRILSSQLTLEEIFKDRQTFKQKIIDTMQEELDKFGLFIYNMNVKELKDHGDSNYFFNMRQKKLSEAENSAKIDIAEATKHGEIGKKEREATTRQEIAKLEAKTVQIENEARQDIELFNAQLNVVRANASQTTNIARIEADNNSQLKAFEMQKIVEEKKFETEIARYRATNLSESKVKAESQIIEAEGHAKSVEINAMANLVSKIKEAEGVLSLLNAQATGLQNLVNSLDGDKSALAQYLMIERGTYVDLADKNAQALQKLKPKITIWNTDKPSDSTISNILKMLPPLLTTIHDQTGIKLPNSILEMPLPQPQQKNVE